MKQYRANPEYYDAEYEHMNMLRQDVPFFLGHLPKKRQDVLELAVGTARAAIPLAQAGHRVVGVDIDSRMLTIARRKRDAVGLSEREPELRKMDVLKLNLGRKFDWICLFFNTFLAFTTLEQQDRLLRNVVKHLKPRGRFWLDIFFPDASRMAEAKSVDLHPQAFFVPRYGRTVHHTATVTRNLSRQLQRVTFNYKWFDERGHEHLERTEFDLTFLYPRELQILLERNGLRVLKMYGNYDGSELRDNSPRMIVVCGLL